MLKLSKSMLVTLILLLVISVGLLGCQPAEVVDEKEEIAFPKAGKTLTLLVGFSPGGLSDRMTRDFQPFFEEELGINAEVLNMPGAGGLIGFNELSRRPADGYTVSIITSSWGHHTFPHISQESPPWEFDDFRLLGIWSENPNPGLITVPDAPWENFSDLILDARERPGEITMAILGPGQVFDLQTLEIEELFDVEFNKVFYDSGGPMMTDLLTGDLDVAMRAATGVAEDPSFKVITFFYWGDYPENFKYQDIPNISDSKEELNISKDDIKLLDDRELIGFVVRSDTPEEIFNTLSKALENIVNNPEWKAQVADHHASTTWVPPNEANEMYRNLNDFIIEILN